MSNIIGNSIIVQRAFLHLVFKSNLLLFSLCYAEACTSLRGSSPRYCTRTTQLLPLKKCHRGDELGNTVSDLTGTRFEPQTFCSRDKRVTDRPI